MVVVPVATSGAHDSLIADQDENHESVYSDATGKSAILPQAFGIAGAIETNDGAWCSVD